MKAQCLGTMISRNVALVEQKLRSGQLVLNVYVLIRPVPSHFTGEETEVQGHTAKEWQSLA